MFTEDISNFDILCGVEYENTIKAPLIWTLNIVCTYNLISLYLSKSMMLFQTVNVHFSQIDKNTLFEQTRLKNIQFQQFPGVFCQIVH